MRIGLPSVFILAAWLAGFGGMPASGQTQFVTLKNGSRIKITAKFNRPLRPGPAQKAKVVKQSAAGGLTFYTANYSSLGVKPLPFNIVGTDPSAGAATSVIPVVIVPLQFVFADGTVLDGANAVAAIQNSPIFQTVDFSTGGTALGHTQYGDAVQRAQFWNLAGFSAAGYHVLLGAPSVDPALMLTVPAGQGSVYTSSAGVKLGVVAQSVFDSALQSLYTNYTPDTLPVFLTDNVYLSNDGTMTNGCCSLGYHASEGPPIQTARTWIYSSYTEAGTFDNNAVVDVATLSHEVSQWMNDPFVGAPFAGGINFVAPALLPNQNGACTATLETGDALDSPEVLFTVQSGGKTYHLQDEALLPWFLHGTSFSANGTYSYLGTLTTPSTLCRPG